MCCVRFDDRSVGAGGGDVHALPPQFGSRRSRTYEIVRVERWTRIPADFRTRLAMRTRCAERVRRTRLRDVF